MKNKTGFTLVELLVVITVLAILGTIAFVIFKGNVSESRDAARNSDMNEVVNVLELFQTENGFFPEPSDSVDITYSGSALAWKQGNFGESVGRIVKVFGSDVPVDPKFKNFYSYSVTARANEFQIGAIHEKAEEEEGLGELALQNIVSQAHAGSIETALVKGDYNGFMVKARTPGGSNDYYIATPSIIATDISNPDVVDIITERKLVYDKFFNLPASYSGFLDVNGGFNFNVSDPLIYSGNSNELKSESVLLDFNENLKYIYATTPTESFDKYLSVLEKEGLTSLKGFLTRKFKIIFRSYFNCKDILDDGLSEGDGMYTIDPDGDGEASPYEVFCDMTTDGGGWTRVGDNHIQNADFSGGNGITGAYSYPVDRNEIVALNTQVEGNTYALHQTGNYSSYYKVSFQDPSILKPGYEVRMTTWRSDYGTGSESGENSGSTHVTLMGGKDSPWTIGTCTSGNSCQFKNFNVKMLNSGNFGAGGALTDVSVSLKDPVASLTTSYLDGGVLFDGYIPDAIERYTSQGNIKPYTLAEIQAIDDWVQAGGFLISTNNGENWDPIGEFYDMPAVEYNSQGSIWDIENVDHPLINGSVGLKIDLRGEKLVGNYAHTAFQGSLQSSDTVIARDHSYPYAPTVILRKHGRGHILFVADDGMFKQIHPGDTFKINDNESIFAAAIVAYGIETAAGINPHEGYIFHNRIYYNDGTFSTNGEDTTINTITVNDGGTDRVWTKERVRHKIYKTPENFDWFIGLDANNNKDLYFTGMRLELFYR